MGGVRTAVWSLAVLAVAAPAVAVADPPTLDGLYALSVADAAALSLGPGPEVFVERSPWNGIEPNYVMNTVHLFGMSFFTRPQHIAPGACAVTLGFVTFDTSAAPEASEAQKAAIDKLPYGRKPLRWVRFWRAPRYFAAGPAPAAPLKPGGKPEPPAAAALAPDSCENPVSARKLFDAPSPEAAAAAIDRLDSVIAAAKGRGGLRFALTVDCAGVRHACPDARAALAALEPQQIWAYRSSCSDVDPAAANCVDLQIDDPGLGGTEYWDVTIEAGADGKVRAVRLADVVPPVV